MNKFCELLKKMPQLFSCVEEFRTHAPSHESDEVWMILTKLRTTVEDQ